MNSNDKTLIIIPAYNEEGSIGNLCNEEIKQKFLEAFI